MAKFRSKPPVHSDPDLPHGSDPRYSSGQFPGATGTDTDPGFSG